MNDEREDRAPASTAERNVLPIITAVGAAITAALPVLRAFGIDLPADLTANLTALLGALFLLGSLIYARLRTTPLVDPRDAQGRALEPVTGRAPWPPPAQERLLGPNDVDPEL